MRHIDGEIQNLLKHNRIMVKEKKITIKHFLNEQVRPSGLWIPSTEHFPVYTRITYNRKTTNLNLFPEVNQKGLTNDEFFHFFVERNEPLLKTEIERMERGIRSVIAYEEKTFGKEFTLKGLSKRLVYYFETIHNLYNRTANKYFAIDLEDHITVTEYKELYSIGYSSNNIYPQGDDFIRTYHRIKFLYDSYPIEKVQGFGNITMYRGFAQLLHFENHKGHYIEVDDKEQQFIPKRYLFIDWIQGSVKSEFGQFMRENDILLDKGEPKMPYHLSKHQEVEREKWIKEIIDELPIKRTEEIEQTLSFVSLLVKQTYY